MTEHEEYQTKYTRPRSDYIRIKETRSGALTESGIDCNRVRETVIFIHVSALSLSGLLWIQNLSPNTGHETEIQPG